MIASFPISTLAQVVTSPAPAGDTTQVITLVGILIGVLVVMTGILMFIRRRFLTSQKDTAQQAGLLEQLRQMKLSGQLSEDEYNAARSKLAAKMRASAAESRPIPKATRTPTSPPRRPPPPAQRQGPPSS